MQWPNPFYQLVNIQQSIASAGKLMSLDCFFQLFTRDDTFYLNIMLNFFTPIILGITIVMV